MHVFSILTWCTHIWHLTHTVYMLRGHCTTYVTWLCFHDTLLCVDVWLKSFPWMCVWLFWDLSTQMSKLTTVIAVWTADVHRRLNAARCWQSPTPSPRPCLQRGQETSTCSSRGPNPWAESQLRSRVRRNGLSGRGESREIGRDLSNWAYGARTDVYGHVFLDGDGELFSLTHRHRAKPERKRVILTLIHLDELHPKQHKVHGWFLQSHRWL